MSEEGFHEIQLNGKQLVFLFITVTVVSVVIFLCGVLVGRGVRAERADAAVASAVAPMPAAPQPLAAGTLEGGATAQPAPSEAAATDPATAAPPPADEFSYDKRLESDKEPKEKLKAQPESKPAPAAKTPPAPSQPPTPEPQKQTAASSEPTGVGFAVQIAALRDRAEADGIVKRLTGKGYPAYVMAPPPGGAVAVYRIRVGKYKNRREAESIATRLEKEEQFRPWILR